MDVANHLSSLSYIPDIETIAKLLVLPEKPKHQQYLAEFRTKQCRPFVEHKCQNHRPYNCFNWHFPNQQRRQPIKRSDGTFNYNPDVYCTKYDENTGICVDGENCPYVHRNAGDTERRYHPRYFKTGICIFETTEDGHCVKNGVHCAFAHGLDDLRLPVYDIREAQCPAEHNINLPASLEKERVLSEDPKWNDVLHVLAHYKTEVCKKPPRMCRQGYACPFYHNNKDKRRNPAEFRYRSTPCPTVKPADEWQDCGLCEAGDTCGYCHTRTEQQFHPEIYKSTKCNDMLHNGYCPRGPFCAFAHEDPEMNIGRDFMVSALSSKESGGNGTGEGVSRLPGDVVDQGGGGGGTPQVVSLMGDTTGGSPTIPASRSGLRLNTLATPTYGGSPLNIPANSASLLQAAMWAAAASSPSTGSPLLPPGSPVQPPPSLASQTQLPSMQQLLAQRIMVAANNPQAFANLLGLPSGSGATHRPVSLLGSGGTGGGYQMSGSLPSQLTAFGQSARRRTPSSSSTSGKVRHASGYSPLTPTHPMTTSTLGTDFLSPEKMPPVVQRGLAKPRPLFHSQPPMDPHAPMAWLPDVKSQQAAAPPPLNTKTLMGSMKQSQRPATAATTPLLAPVDPVQNTPINIESILGNALGESYRFSPLDLNELNNLPEEEISEEQFYQHGKQTVSSGVGLLPGSGTESPLTSCSTHSGTSGRSRTPVSHSGGWPGGGGGGGSSYRSAPVNIPPTGIVKDAGTYSTSSDCPSVSSLVGSVSSFTGTGMGGQSGGGGGFNLLLDQELASSVQQFYAERVARLAANGGSGSSLASSGMEGTFGATSSGGPLAFQSGVLRGTPLSMTHDPMVVGGDFTAHLDPLSMGMQDTFSNLGQSPFSNAASDIERLCLQQQVEQYKAQLDTAQDELESTKRERDVALLRLEESRRYIENLSKSPSCSSHMAAQCCSTLPDVLELSESGNEPLLRTLTHQMLEEMVTCRLGACENEVPRGGGSSGTEWENNNKPVEASASSPEGGVVVNSTEA